VINATGTRFEGIREAREVLCLSSSGKGAGYYSGQTTAIRRGDIEACPLVFELADGAGCFRGPWSMTWLGATQRQPHYCLAGERRGLTLRQGNTPSANGWRLQKSDTDRPSGGPTCSEMDGNPGPGGFDRPKCFGLKPLAPLKLKLHFTGADNCCKFRQLLQMRDD
jgi:hypothetical protein